MLAFPNTIQVMCGIYLTCRAQQVCKEEANVITYIYTHRTLYSVARYGHAYHILLPKVNIIAAVLLEPTNSSSKHASCLHNPCTVYNNKQKGCACCTASQGPLAQ